MAHHRAIHTRLNLKMHTEVPLQLPRQLNVHKQGMVMINLWKLHQLDAVLVSEEDQDLQVCFLL